MNGKKIVTIIAIILVIALIAYLGYGYYEKFFKEVKNPIVTMEIEGYGTIKLELYPDLAPNTVANFIRLANRGFYNGLTFHRTIPDFMIQGGDANGDGSGSPKLSNIIDNGEDKTYNINGEFSANGYKKNTLKHEEGVISMARSDYASYASAFGATELTQEGYNSAGSQFFIMTKASTSLNGLYTAFGKVIEGLDVVHAIENVEVVTRDSNADGTDKPVTPPVIKTVSVETFGVDYGIPETHDVFSIQNWYTQNFGTTTK